ncbi:hypothetical protein, partial [Klebsiella pneumoniae]|uniref:hypothetical protein n=1 Tax=Klebsiella pneumoniae TaxID=573 RepID=UPI002841ACB4
RAYCLKTQPATGETYPKSDLFNKADSFLHQASFVTRYWCYDRHRSVHLVICFDLAIDQIAQSGLSSL